MKFPPEKISHNPPLGVFLAPSLSVQLKLLAYLCYTGKGYVHLPLYDVARYFSIMLPGTFYNVARKYPTLARNFNYICQEL